MLLLATTTIMVTMLSACGGSSSGDPQSSGTLSGNWQFTTTNPDPTVGQPGGYPATALYGLQGGFLLQNNGSVTGQAVYSIAGEQTNNQWAICDSGSAPITGTVSGQNVILTVAAPSQTFMLQGTLGSNGNITSQNGFTTTGGTATGFSSCGTATPSGGLSWNAVSVPPISGTIQGSFHSTGNTLGNQDFPVTGSFTQGENIGASNATVTGTLSFIDPATNLSDYPCFSVASVNGQISGNSVILQIIGTNGATVGQIGAPAGSTTSVNPVTFDSVQGGYILHGLQPTYMVAASGCPGSLGNTTTAGDSGNICLALNSTTACQQPTTLTPAAVTFPAQMLGSAATTQTITLANNSSAAISGLMVNFTNQGDNQFIGQSDFNGLPSFSETDACGAGGAPSQGEPFDLGSGQSCFITVIFSPQESCPWLPFGTPAAITGAPPEWCALPQGAQVTVTSPASADSDKAFAVPISGIGISAIQPSTPELDFGAEEPLNPPEASLPQTLSFTNNSGSPLQILSSAPCTRGQLKLPHPLLQGSPVAGLQVVASPPNYPAIAVAVGNTTISYSCDIDSGTFLPNFQISSDTCTGTVLTPQASCSLQVAYIPQPNTDINGGLDYFLELNTVQCSSEVTADCEIDSGRFSVELKANTPSPLRMSPSAGLDFGSQAKGSTSAPLTIALLNDPSLASPQTVSFVGKIVAQGNYAETDDCPVTLAPGSSCTLSVTFKPSGVGFEPGNLTINYSPEPFGVPQVVYLRGTGH